MTTSSTESSRQPARVLIADDNLYARLGLQLSISDVPDLVLIGEAADGAQAVSLCDTLQPDLVVLDHQMPVLDGMAATATIKAAHPDILVLVVSAYDTPDSRAQAAAAGADGFMPKDAIPDEFVTEARRLLSRVRCA
jgi:DNA-binding NarL/FixJ family response regulator